MKWISHQCIAVGAAYCLGMSLPVLAGVWVGSVLPDVLDQRIAGLFRNRQKAFNQIHRGATHWFGWWLALWVAMLVPWGLGSVQLVIAGVGFGALMHVALDMCTVSGVPIVPWSRKNKVSLSLCSTGSPTEYVLLGATMLLFVLLQGDEVWTVLDQAKALGSKYLR